MTGEMYAHDDEPDLKKTIVDDPEEGIDIDNLVWATRARGSPVEGRVFAASGVGDPLAGLPEVVGCPRPAVEDDPEVTRLRKEDELILSKAMLGQSLHEVYSNARIHMAVSRNSMERLNAQLSSTDVCEIFSPARVAKVCKAAGLTPGESMDIRQDAGSR